MDIHVSMTFDAAHRLTRVPQGHKCGNLHGHTFTAEFHASGPLDPNTGWVMDFADLKAAAKPHVKLLDHTYLNDIPGLDNPTSENIAKWLWTRIKPTLPALSRIVVRESPTSAASYQGE